MSNKHRDKSVRFVLLNAAALAGLLATPAFAQDAPADEEEIVVTGYRASLRSSTEAKRDSVAILDSVFAEDIGKFPDLTIAESLNRIPGVQIARDVAGEGFLISVRGLGTNFTKIMMNGAQIAVASSGSFDNQNQNREVDLGIFPIELFARLDVQKTPMASNLEGGVAGLVNMRAARPFDYEDDQLTYQLQGNYGESSEEFSWRGGAVGSMRWDTGIGEIGVLGGVALVRNKFLVEGFETIGWTNPSLTAIQCGPAPTSAAACNTTGGNNYSIPATVPAGAGAGLIAGTTVDYAFLLAQNPGVTTQQIGDMLIPRLGRLSHSAGDRNRDAGVLGLQWRPNDSAEIYLDIMGLQTHREFDRIDMNWVGRNGSTIPIGVEIAENGVVTSGTFANAQWFLEARPYQEDIEFLSINPGASFVITDSLEWNVAANYTRSNFYRRDPTILVITPLGQGTVVEFNNPDQPFPDITTNIDLNDPNAGWQWNGGRLNLTQEKRVTYTQGFHTDLRFGGDENNIRAGIAWDEIGRTISSRNNDAAWENFACRNGFTGTGTRPACAGGPGSAIEQSELASYLLPGPGGFITVDFDRFLADTNYEALSATAGENNTATTGAGTGIVDEATVGLWIEANGRFGIFNRPFAYNIGVREIETKQVIAGPVTVAGVRQYRQEPSTYNETLPSLNVAYDILEDVKLRFAASRTLTRPNPSVMLPTGVSNPGGLENIVFSDPTAQNATQGNPDLGPFTSDNFDIGAEWYTGGEGYVALTGFRRELIGFTETQITTYPFAALGIPLTDLNQTLQDAINTFLANTGNDP